MTKERKATGIKTWPEDDRPREKLLKKGAGALSNSELLAKHDVIPWFNYFLGTVLAAYKEFEERAGNIKPGRGIKTQIVTQAIERQIGEFAISEIERECPGVSRPMIRVILENLRAKGKVEVLGTGRSARWRKRDNKS